MTGFDVIVFTIVIIGVGTTVLFYFFVLLPIGLPFVPSADSAMSEIFSLLGDINEKKVLDLGSGNGKIVIAAAQRGAHAVGFEINPLLAWLSRKKISRTNLTGTARIQLADFWSTDISEYDIIIFYGTVPIVKRLEHKLEQELKTGARVITSYCALPTWETVAQKGNVLLYKKTDKKRVSKDYS